jgi:hypothetical protein
MTSLKLWILGIGGRLRAFHEREPLDLDRKDRPAHGGGQRSDTTGSNGADFDDFIR